MTRLYLFLLLLLPVFGIGQRYMNYSKQTLRDSLLVKKDQPFSVTGAISEIDGDLIYTINPPGNEQTIYRYGFDSLGKCNKEKITAACDTCLYLKLQGILNTGSYKWKKINENQYVSRFEDYLMIEISVNKQEFAFTIHRMSWTQLLYDILLGK